MWEKGSKQKSDPLAEFWIQLQGGTRLRTPTQSTQSHQLIHFLPSSTLRLAEPGWTIALRVGELGVMVECPKFEGWMVASDPLRSNVRVICLIKLMFCDVPYCSIWSTVPVRLGPSQDAIRIVQGMMTVVAQLGMLTGDHKPFLNWSIKTSWTQLQFAASCRFSLSTAPRHFSVWSECYRRHLYGVGCGSCEAVQWLSHKPLQHLTPIG